MKIWLDAMPYVQKYAIVNAALQAIHNMNMNKHSLLYSRPWNR